MSSSHRSAFGAVAVPLVLGDREVRGASRRYAVGVRRTVAALGVAGALFAAPAGRQDKLSTLGPVSSVHAAGEQTVEPAARVPGIGSGPVVADSSPGRLARRDGAGVGGPTTTSPAGDQDPVQKHVEVILDSMLRTGRVAPGTPLADRMGQVSDPRLVPIIRNIDDSLGGGIEWPHVTVVQGLEQSRGVSGAYAFFPGTDGRTPPTPQGSIGLVDNAGPLAVRAAPDSHPDGGVLDIRLDRDLVDRYFAGENQDRFSLRYVLVHELQHAMSHDSESALLAAAPSQPIASETRATVAGLVAQEMLNRGDDGPRLNALPDAERRELLAETLGPYVSDDWANAGAEDRSAYAAGASHGSGLSCRGSVGRCPAVHVRYGEVRRRASGSGPLRSGIGC